MTRRGAPPAGERLTRDTVVARASDLIERDGGDTFSLRALAKDLNVQPAALYNHVTGLADLLDAVAGRFVADLDLHLTEPDTHWADWLRTVASTLYQRMSAQPELTGLVLARAPRTAAGPALLHGVIDRLEAGGLTRAVAHLAWHAVLTTVVGSLSQERARNRHRTDTFDAVLAVVITGLTGASTRDDDQVTRLLVDHGC
ncbi:TetR/AcrR family transcriptional regulator [Actinophytocola xinjiangensis]|uniref:TetR/AcrR family transcriptional regulator n=1 Tax=Actinophytocola xinjiangensis TaxID=485602 RepID=UPI000AF84D59|nr:TetR/AcrR family transcriptional regulator C-terminal domain-containing protein [Actinophytocola xinjiangensis]